MNIQRFLKVLEKLVAYNVQSPKAIFQTQVNIKKTLAKRVCGAPDCWRVFFQSQCHSLLRCLCTRKSKWSQTIAFHWVFWLFGVGVCRNHGFSLNFSVFWYFKAFQNCSRAPGLFARRFFQSSEISKKSKNSMKNNGFCIPRLQKVKKLNEKQWFWSHRQQTIGFCSPDVPGTLKLPPHHTPPEPGMF